MWSWLLNKHLTSFFIGMFGFITYRLFNRSKGPTCKIIKDLTSKVILITGGNSGLGRETARQLSNLGASVIIASTNWDSSFKTIQQFKKTNPSIKIEYMYLDLSQYDTVHNFVREFKKKYSRLDILINNSGVIKYDREVNRNNHEITISINYLGHFLLTYLLLDLLKISAPSRIINISSTMHFSADFLNLKDFFFEESWNSMTVYKTTKLYNVMMTKHLHLEYNKDGIYSFSLSPGLVRTGIYWHRPWHTSLFFLIFYPYIFLFGKSCFLGSQTCIYLALEELENLQSGEYYMDMKQMECSKFALNEDDNRKLWDYSLQLLRLQ